MSIGFRVARRALKENQPPCCHIKVWLSSKVFPLSWYIELDTYNCSMKRTLLLLTLPLLAATCTCGRRSPVNDVTEVLAQMRADTAWIRKLDSLAATAIGPGARCIDPVWHCYRWEERTWFFNEDWGGVLEIPSDYIPQDDLIQAGLSFHGTTAISPDSLVRVSFYAGFQGLEYDEYLPSITDHLREYGFTASSISVNDQLVTLEASNGEGVIFYGRYLYASKDGIEYSVSLQYPREMDPDMGPVRSMVDRYPYGADGGIFSGLAYD